jgi:3-oxoacyl-[acyl-carrier protein] reductase
MRLELENRRAWVLGASSGLGRAVAESLAEEGARLAISSRDRDRLEAAGAQLARTSGRPVVTEVLDVADGPAIATTCERVVDRLGGLDILVCNHGGPPTGGLESISPEVFAEAFQLVLASAFLLTKAAEPHLSRNGGTIVFVVSSSTKEVIPDLLLSNVMRMGVVGLAKSVARELGPRGVRVLCVAPGRFDTERVRNLDDRRAASSGRTPDQVRSETINRIPLGRYGAPDQFGDVVAFLCSERASYLSGSTVVVDGGMLASTSS